MPDNALLNRLNEIAGNLREISSALDASANVLELEVNEDSAELRASFDNLIAAAGRARTALAELRARREGPPPDDNTPRPRSPIDDGE